MIENAHKTIENAQERSETVRDDQEWSETITLYKITVTFTLQKRITVLDEVICILLIEALFKVKVF